MNRSDAEDFLFHEAALLDSWKLRDWLALFTPDARYLVPPTDAPDSDPSTTLFLIADDRTLLGARVGQLLDGTNLAELPRSRTTRLITNCRIVPSAGELEIRSNFVVHRFRGERSDSFVGTYTHVLAITDGGPRIRSKRIQLAHEHLHVQGKISILL